MRKVFVLLFLVLALTQCGNNPAKGQIIPGTNGITVERCNEIVNALGGDPKYFSKELEGLVKEFDAFPMSVFSRRGIEPHTDALCAGE